MGGAGRGGSGGSGGFQRLRRAVSAGGAALPTGDAQPRAGPPWRSSAPVTSVGLPGGCSGPPVGPDPEGSSRIAFPGDALLPPEMMLAPLRGDAQPPPGGWTRGDLPFLTPPGDALLSSLPPRGWSPWLPGRGRSGDARPCRAPKDALPPPEGAHSLRGGFISHPVTPWRGCLSQGVLSSPISPGLSLGWGVSFSPRAGLEGVLLWPGFTRRPSI